MKKAYKNFLIVAVFLFCIVLLSGCGSKDYPSWDGTNYLDANGKIIEDDQVTLDVVARRLYKKNFNDIKGKGKEAKREDVIREYLSYHLLQELEGSDRANVEPLLNMFFNDQEKITDITLEPEEKSALGKMSNGIGEISTGITLAKFCGDNNKEFKEFVGIVGDGAKVVDTLTTAARAYFMVLDLSNNNISNPEEYCTDVIDALALITKNLPFFGKYFEKTLSCTRTGVQVVIKKAEIKKNLIEQYGKEIDGATFFSIQNYEKILKPAQWDDGDAPTVSDILGKMLATDSGFGDLDEKALECVRSYLLYRIQFEQQNPEEQEDEIASEISSAILYDGHRYKAYDIQMSWYEAKERCEELGGHLVTITSAEEQAFLEGFSGRYWIGATDEANEGTWVWVTGEAWSYENWRSGEPNNRGDENYLTIWPDTWNDLCENSKEQSGFICEWDRAF